MKSLSVLLLCVLPLSSCVTDDGDPWLARQTGTTTNLAATAPGGNRSIPPELAWARLAGVDQKPISARSLSGEHTQVQQVIYPNRTTATGENVLTVEKGPVDLERLRKAPSRTALAAEMRAALPGVSLSTEDVPRHNAYGPYGVATGSMANGSSCVFAWQTIEKWPEGGTTSREAGKIRLRYCAPGASKEALANLLASLSLTGGLYGYATPLIPAVSAAPEQTQEPDLVQTPRRTLSSHAHGAERAGAGTVSAAASVKAKSDVAEKTWSVVSIPMPDG